MILLITSYCIYIIIKNAYKTTKFIFITCKNSLLYSYPLKKQDDFDFENDFVIV